LGIFSIIGNGYPFQEVVIMLLAWVIAIMVALVAHEYMHAYTAHKCGDDTAKMAGRLTLNPAKHFELSGFLCMLLIGFGWAKGVPVNDNNFRDVKKGRIWVSLSGVLMNLFLGVVFIILTVLLLHYFATTDVLILRFVIYLCMYLGSINIVLGIFNLLPIYPLDGYNFVSAYLRYDNKYCQFMRQYGAMILFGILIVSAFIPEFGLGQLFGMVYDLLYNAFNSLFF